MYKIYFPLHIYFKLYHFIMSNTYIEFFLCLKSINLSIILRTAREYGMFRRQAITVLVVISGEILRCTRTSSRQYFAAPSIEIGYPSPFTAMTPAFVPRLLVKAILILKSLFQTSWQVHFERSFFPARSTVFQ